MKRVRQRAFDFPEHGGARRGAGRKRRAERQLVEHRARPVLCGRHPVHVTLRVEPGLESLRRRRPHRAVRDALIAASGRFGVRIVQFTVMTNHVHLVCEAPDERALARSMKGLAVRISRRLNGLWGRKGRVLADRYHVHVLKSPREVWNALAYVLQNAHLHGIHFAGPDPCSTGMWFDGWAFAPRATASALPSPLPEPRTWLLRIGWKRHGPIPLPIRSPERASTRARSPTPTGANSQAAARPLVEFAL